MKTGPVRKCDSDSSLSSRLVLTNLALYYVCRKRIFSPGSSTSSLIEQAHYNVAARHKLNKVDPAGGASGEQPQQLFHMQHYKREKRSSIEDSIENVDCCCPTPGEEKVVMSQLNCSKCIHYHLHPFCNSEIQQGPDGG